jgi:hypothetical protein
MSLRGLNRLSLPLNTLANDTPSTTSSSSSSTRPALSSYFNESNIHQDIKIAFILPNGDIFEEVVKNGETVQEIKRRLYSDSKIPSNSLFFFNGQCMLDPLSLNDIPGFVGDGALKIEVKVKGQTTSDDVTKPTSSGASDSTKPTPPTTSPTISTPKTTDTQNEQPTNITNNKPPTILEENAEQMYTTGNGKDERRDSLPRGRDEPDLTPINGNDLPSNTPIPNFVEPATSSPDTLSTIPSLPGHAAFDDEAVPNTGLEHTKSGKEGDTTIDVKDDESHGQKPIQTLGSGKQRWFCRVV